MFQLTGAQPELLGRQASIIKLTDAQTSRKHAEILLENNTWLIRDLNSTNGTWVNGQKILQITELEAGDRIVIGRHQFRVSVIDNIPAPNPQPLASPPEPIIGNEELATMGVDLAESLSADILEEEDLELPNFPDESSPDEAADQDKAPPVTEPTPVTPDQTQQPDTAPDDQDGIIDLDALLQEPPSEEPPATSADTTGEDNLDADDHSPPANQAEQGVIDLDELLNEAEQPPASTPTPQDILAPDDVPTKTPQADSTTEHADEDFDLDEMLKLDEPKDSTPPPSAPETIHSLDTPDEVVPDQDQATPSVDAPVSDAEHPPEITDKQPATAPDNSSDHAEDPIEDIDALLEELTDDHEPKVESEPELDREAEAEQDTSSPDISGEPSDGLIDFDILAAAKPTDSWDQSPPAPQEDQEAPPTITDTQPADDALKDSGAGTDDSDILDSADTGADLDEDTDNQDAPITAPTTDESQTPPTQAPHDEPGDANEQDELGDVVPADQVDDQADDLTEELEDELDNSERALLLSPDEQTQAVQGYKRSRLKTLVTLALIVTTLGIAGWYAFDRFTNHADANSLPSKQDESTPPHTANDTSPISTLDRQTDPPTSAAQTTAPQTPQKPTHDTPPQDLQPEHSDPAAETKTPAPPPPDTTAPVILKPTPQQAAPPPPTRVSIADPFADVTTTVTDPTPTPTPPDATPPQLDQPATPTTPDAPVASATSDPQKTQEPTRPISAATTPSHQTTTAQDTHTAINTQISTEPTPTTDAAHNPLNTDATTPASTDQSQLNLLAGIVDAQHPPGNRVSDQAAFAGARRIVYLIDASGSLVDSFPHVLNELNRTLSSLPEDQVFTAIFFGSDGIIELPPAGLKWADRQTIRQAHRWIDPAHGNVTAWGRGDFLQAMQLAVGYDADEIVVLSDNLIGQQASPEKIDTLLDDIASLIDGQVTQIHVIQFFTRDPKQILKSIAERFDGTYNLIPNMPTTHAEQAAIDPLATP